MPNETERAEARKTAMREYLSGNVPDQGKYRDTEDFLERRSYIYIQAFNGEVSTHLTSPDWLSADIEDALRMDGIEEFTLTHFDEHFEYLTWHVWWEGTKRHYREIGHGSVVTVHLVPAGTLPEVD